MMLTLLMGLVLIFLGILVLFLSQRKEKKDRYFPNSGKDEEQTKMRGGGVVMIGPIPIVLGSDPKIALLMMAMALAMMILWHLTDKGA